MGWEKLTTEDVLSEFTLAEANSLRILQGSGSGSGSGGGLPFENMDVIVARAVDEVRGFIVAGGYDVDPIDGTLPLGLFADAVAIARWRLLVSVPALKQLQTDERKATFDAAMKKMLMIADQQFSVEPPTDNTTARTGNWNSENKLLMRTHPIPRPATQFTPQTNTYANPDAPADQTNDA